MNFEGLDVNDLILNKPVQLFIAFCEKLFVEAYNVGSTFLKFLITPIYTLYQRYLPNLDILLPNSIENYLYNSKITIVGFMLGGGLLIFAVATIVRYMIRLVL